MCNGNKYMRRGKLITLMMKSTGNLFMIFMHWWWKTRWWSCPPDGRQGEWHRFSNRSINNCPCLMICPFGTEAARFCWGLISQVSCHIRWVSISITKKRGTKIFKREQLFFILIVKTFPFIMLIKHNNQLVPPFFPKVVVVTFLCGRIPKMWSLFAC